MAPIGAAHHRNLGSSTREMGRDGFSDARVDPVTTTI